MSDLTCAQGQSRTVYTRIFSPLLYQLSYLGFLTRQCLSEKAPSVSIGCGYSRLGAVPDRGVPAGRMRGSSGATPAAPGRRRPGRRRLRLSPPADVAWPTTEAAITRRGGRPQGHSIGAQGPADRVRGRRLSLGAPVRNSWALGGFAAVLAASSRATAGSYRPNAWSPGPAGPARLPLAARQEKQIPREPFADVFGARLGRFGRTRCPRPRPRRTTYHRAFSRSAAGRSMESVPRSPRTKGTFPRASTSPRRCAPQLDALEADSEELRRWARTRCCPLS